MALPELVRAAAEKELDTFCEERVPLRVRDEVRLEYSVRGDTLTLVERRVAWRPKSHDEPWTTQPIAQFRFDSKVRLWTLFWPDRDGHWHRDDAPPANGVGALLDVVDRDPTGIYWG
jgi:hypothetical protein